MMTIPEIYAKAATLLLEEQPRVYRLGTAHPNYQDALRVIVARLTRDNR